MSSAGGPLPSPVRLRGRSQFGIAHQQAMQHEAVLTAGRATLGAFRTLLEGGTLNPRQHHSLRLLEAALTPFEEDAATLALFQDDAAPLIPCQASGSLAGPCMEPAPPGDPRAVHPPRPAAATSVDRA